MSAASAWEIAIKRKLGKLKFNGSAATAIGTNGFFQVPLVAADGEAAGEMEWEHKDPFDKLPMVQAKRLGRCWCRRIIRCGRLLAQVYIGLNQLGWFTLRDQVYSKRKEYLILSASKEGFGLAGIRIISDAYSTQTG